MRAASGSRCWSAAGVPRECHPPRSQPATPVRGNDGRNPRAMIKRLMQTRTQAQEHHRSSSRPSHRHQPRRRTPTPHPALHLTPEVTLARPPAGLPSPPSPPPHAVQYSTFIGYRSPEHLRRGPRRGWYCGAVESFQGDAPGVSTLWYTSSSASWFNPRRRRGVQHPARRRCDCKKSGSPGFA